MFDLLTNCGSTAVYYSPKFTCMVLQDKLFANALSIEDMERRFKDPLPGVLSFLFESSCIDTQPPLPPGAGG